MCDQEKECKKECKKCYYYSSDGYTAKCDYKLPKLGWTNKYFDNRLFGDVAENCKCYVSKCDACRYSVIDEDDRCVNYDEFKVGCIECSRIKREDEYGLCEYMNDGICIDYSLIDD